MAGGELFGRADRRARNCAFTSIRTCPGIRPAVIRRTGDSRRAPGFICLMARPDFAIDTLSRSRCRRCNRPTRDAV